MKLLLSDLTVRKLIFMLDDCYRLDVGHDKEHQMWSDFDCLSILRDLMSANNHRSNDGLIDVSEETVSWLGVVLEDRLANDEPPSKSQLSDATLQALVKVI